MNDSSSACNISAHTQTDKKKNNVNKNESKLKIEFSLAYFFFLILIEQFVAAKRCLKKNKIKTIKIMK